MKNVFYKISVALVISLFILSQVVLPAFAQTTVQLVLDTDYIGGFVYNPNGSYNLTSSDVLYKSSSSNISVGSYGTLNFSVYDISTTYFPRPVSGQNMDGNLYLKFKLNSNSSTISNEVLSSNLILGFGIPGYRQNYSYGITSLYLTGGTEAVSTNTPDFIYFKDDLGIKFYQLNFSHFSVPEGYTVTGDDFREFTMEFYFTGLPNTGYIEFYFWNESFVVLSGYSPDNNGIVQGLDDVRNEVNRTNDLLEEPLSNEQEDQLDDMNAENANKRAEVDSAVEQLDQFEKPDIDDSQSSVVDGMLEYNDSIVLFKPEEGSSEFIDTCVSMGVPSLGICVLGYILYGKKEG